MSAVEAAGISGTIPEFAVVILAGLILSSVLGTKESNLPSYSDNTYDYGTTIYKSEGTLVKTGSIDQELMIQLPRGTGSHTVTITFTLTGGPAVLYHPYFQQPGYPNYDEYEIYSGGLVTKTITLTLSFDSGSNPPPSGGGGTGGRCKTGCTF